MSSVRSGGRDPRDLIRALCVHLLALVVYAVISYVFFYLAGKSFTLEGSGAEWIAEGLAAAWLLFAGSFTWLLVLAGVIRWWWQGRPRLVHRTLLLDSLLWLGPWLLLLIPWKRTRRLITPPSPPEEIAPPG
jgi:hypothetical protein